MTPSCLRPSLADTPKILLPGLLRTWPLLILPMCSLMCVPPFPPWSRSLLTPLSPRLLPPALLLQQVRLPRCLCSLPAPRLHPRPASCPPSPDLLGPLLRNLIGMPSMGSFLSARTCLHSNLTGRSLLTGRPKSPGFAGTRVDPNYNSPTGGVGAI